MEDEHSVDAPSLALRKRYDADTRLRLRPQYTEPMFPPTIEDAHPSLLLEYWDIFRRRKGALVLIAFLGLLVSVLLTVPQTPLYQARASLEIRSFNDNFLNMRNVSPTTSEGTSSSPEFDLRTQVKILQSESVLERVGTKLELEKKMSRGKSIRLSAWRKALGLLEPSPTPSREEIIRAMTSNLTIRTEPNTRLVEVLYDSTDPQLAADIVNGVISEFIEKNLEDRGQTTQETGKWLARQMENVRNKLEKSEDELQSYANASGLLFTSEKDNVAEATFRQLQEEFSKAKADRIAKQSRYELAATAPADSLPEVLDDSTLKEYQLKLTDLRRQVAELSSALTASHPSVKKVQAQVMTLESALERKRTSIIERTRNEFKSAQRRESLLAANYASQVRIMSDQAAKVSHYDILKREVDTNRQLYDSMLRSVQQASMTSTLSASNIRVVDAARPPKRPYKPRLVLNSVLGILIGGFFGMVFVVIRERAGRSIQHPGETTLYLDVPELGVVPSAEAEGKRFPYFHRGKSVSILEGDDGNRSKQVELVTARGYSVLADAYRATLTSILYSGENGDRPRVIVLTSASPGEGKTTMASNLALAFSEIGSPVLLMDGDLRQGRLHEIFQTPNSWGLSDLLEGNEPPENTRRMDTGRLVVGTGYKNLFLLPTGSGASNISALLHSPRLKAFLRRMRQEFEMVIIDTPPMLHIPDARLFGRLADGVILVVRSAQTSRNAAAAVSQRLMEDRTRVLGTVLNEWNPAKANQYGYIHLYPYHQQPGTRPSRSAPV